MIENENPALYAATEANSGPFEFEVQKSILFKGNATVKNGHFQFSFYVPKDIDYNFGNGKISYYSCTEHEDAAGSFTDFIIGGMDTTGIDDNESPRIELFMNDENFANGGITGPNPTLIAKISDNFGINTTGNGIGHDLTAILDNSTGNKIILNDPYQTEEGSFKLWYCALSAGGFNTWRSTKISVAPGMSTTTVLYRNSPSM